MIGPEDIHRFRSLKIFYVCPPTNMGKLDASNPRIARSRLNKRESERLGRSAPVPGQYSSACDARLRANKLMVAETYTRTRTSECKQTRTEGSATVRISPSLSGNDPQSCTPTHTQTKSRSNSDSPRPFLRGACQRALLDYLTQK